MRFNNFGKHISTSVSEGIAKALEKRYPDVAAIAALPDSEITLKGDFDGRVTVEVHKGSEIRTFNASGIKFSQDEVWNSEDEDYYLEDWFYSIEGEPVTLS